MSEQAERPKETRGRPRNPTPPAPCQLRIPQRLYKKMLLRADAESLPLATWIRVCCVKELRRKKLV